ncbi:MAG: succinate dehydrogenase [Rhodospirillales bacterium]|nr:succinate dehydrogenase [Rhodospirillales bacterium]
MTPRGQVLLWVAQRGSAAVLGLCVIVHLATIIVAVQGGLTGAEILARVRGSGAWLAFYSLFVAAVAVHGPIGIRTILHEMTALRRGVVDGLAVATAGLILALGFRAAWGLYGAA